MLKKTVLAASLVTASLLFSGWTFPDLGLGAKKEELVLKPYSLSDGVGQKIALSKPKFYLEKDSLFLQNGKKVMDEDGSIVLAYENKGKMYYLVSNEESGALMLKSLADKKVIKDFGTSSRRASFVYDGKLYVATTTKTDAQLYNNVYSNLFAFDGESVDLVQKSIVASGELIAGLNAIATVGDAELQTYGRERSRGYKWSFFDLMTNQPKMIKPSLLPDGGYTFMGKKNGYSYEYVLGFVGDTIVYTYEYKYEDEKGESQVKNILEAQNLATGQICILLNDYDKPFSFLTNRYDVVFKEGNRMIDMRTFRPAAIDANFKPITLRDLNSNLGGGYNESLFPEYNMRKIEMARGQGKTLFKYRY